jgi:hypothetical protein
MEEAVKEPGRSSAPFFCASKYLFEVLSARAGEGENALATGDTGNAGVFK